MGYKKRYLNIKIQKMTCDRLKKLKKLYGFQNLSDTIQMLIGKLNVENLLTEDQKKWCAVTNDLINPTPEEQIAQHLQERDE